ncbi:MAG: hypothetical protein JWO44_1232 [Bacteroidetes bacterium]|nr:hypothetical protein [Bacteroidota bacterium]
MKATLLNTLVTKLRNAIMIIRLHRRFSVKAIPVRVERKILVPEKYQNRY